MARPSINLPSAIALDLLYGLVLTFLFRRSYVVLPGTGGAIKGISFGVVCWFLRVFMGAAGAWIMFAVPITTLMYQMATGLAEMILIGLFIGTALNRNDG